MASQARVKCFIRIPGSDRNYLLWVPVASSIDSSQSDYDRLLEALRNDEDLQSFVHQDPLIEIHDDDAQDYVILRQTDMVPNKSHLRLKLPKTMQLEVKCKPMSMAPSTSLNDTNPGFSHGIEVDKTGCNNEPICDNNEQRSKTPLDSDDDDELYVSDSSNDYGEPLMNSAQPSIGAPQVRYLESDSSTFSSFSFHSAESSPSIDSPNESTDVVKPKVSRNMGMEQRNSDLALASSPLEAFSFTDLQGVLEHHNSNNEKDGDGGEIGVPGNVTTSEDPVPIDVLNAIGNKPQSFQEQVLKYWKRDPQAKQREHIMIQWINKHSKQVAIGLNSSDEYWMMIAQKVAEKTDVNGYSSNKCKDEFQITVDLYLDVQATAQNMAEACTIMSRKYLKLVHVMKPHLLNNLGMKTISTQPLNSPSLDSPNQDLFHPGTSLESSLTDTTDALDEFSFQELGSEKVDATSLSVSLPYDVMTIVKEKRSSFRRFVANLWSRSEIEKEMERYMLNYIKNEAVSTWNAATLTDLNDPKEVTWKNVVQYLRRVLNDPNLTIDYCWIFFNQLLDNYLEVRITSFNHKEAAKIYPFVVESLTPLIRGDPSGRTNSALCYLGVDKKRIEILKAASRGDHHEIVRQKIADYRKLQQDFGSDEGDYFMAPVAFALHSSPDDTADDMLGNSSNGAAAAAMSLSDEFEVVLNGCLKDDQAIDVDPRSSSRASGPLSRASSTLSLGPQDGRRAENIIARKSNAVFRNHATKFLTLDWESSRKNRNLLKFLNDERDNIVGDRLINARNAWDKVAVGMERRFSAQDATVWTANYCRMLFKSMMMYALELRVNAVDDDEACKVWPINFKLIRRLFHRRFLMKMGVSDEFHHAIDSLKSYNSPIAVQMKLHLNSRDNMKKIEAGFFVGQFQYSRPQTSFSSSTQAGSNGANSASWGLSLGNGSLGRQNGQSRSTNGVSNYANKELETLLLGCKSNFIEEMRKLWRQPDDVKQINRLLIRYLIDNKSKYLQSKGTVAPKLWKALTEELNQSVRPQRKIEFYRYEKFNELLDIYESILHNVTSMERAMKIWPNFFRWIHNEIIDQIFLWRCCEIDSQRINRLIKFKKAFDETQASP